MNFVEQGVSIDTDTVAKYKLILKAIRLKRINKF